MGNRGGGTLVRARHESRLERTLHQRVYSRVLILDELGYLPLTREEASSSSGSSSAGTSGPVSSYMLCGIWHSLNQVDIEIVRSLGLHPERERRTDW
jgi:IstB-like ATP binding protein